MSSEGGLRNRKAVAASTSSKGGAGGSSSSTVTNEADASAVAATASSTVNETAGIAADKTSAKSSEELLKKFLQDAQANEQAWDGAWTFWTIILTIVSFLTRVYRINDPAKVVFDEVHFGKFASYYLRHEYYFDVHPPLGKMLLALTGWFVGYDGHFLFDNINDDYIEHNVPYIGLRLWSAICGTLIVPVCFLTMKEIGLSFPAALFGAIMLILENGLITQSRLILLDSMLLLFGVTSLYTWIRFYKQRASPFSVTWWLWLTLTGISLACTLGVKMVGLFTIATVGIGVLVDLWRLWDFDRGVTYRQFARHFAARALCLIFLPLFLYLSFFYIHFKVLSKSGPGDNFMSPAFQAELQGSDVNAFTVAIPYGSNLTIKHREQASYLHSHKDRYPLRYDDGRVSSQGQQVTAYPHKDINNLWTLEHVDPELYPGAGVYTPTEQETERGIRYLRHNDIVRLLHPMTQSYLLTHDVASPLTSSNMEFTTHPADAEDALEKYNDTLFRFEVEDAEPVDKIKSRRSHFKLTSVVHRVAAHTASKSVLPEWGFGQLEVNGNKKMNNDKNNIWYVDEVHHERIVNGTEIGEEMQIFKEKRLNFIEKFMELQSAMLTHNAGLTKPHPYSSTPISWPFVIRGISFWETKENLRQIYLLGNPLIWWSAIGGVFLFIMVWIIDRIALRRKFDLFGFVLRRFFDRGAGFVFVAWMLHYLPFFLMGRMLFLHHYLPSLIFSIMLTASVVDFLWRVLMSENPVKVAGDNLELAAKVPFRAWMKSQGSIVFWSILVVLTSIYTWSFFYFAPFTYGSGFDSLESLKARKWLDGWDFQHT